MQAQGASPLQWGAFTPGVPEVRLFPSSIWNRLQARMWRSATPQELSYATGAGAPDLRKALAEYLQGTRGVACTAEQIVVTSGTQQSLHLVAQMLADPGDSFWLEDPGYWGARSVFRAMGLKLVPVPVDAEGMAPARATTRTATKAMPAVALAPVPHRGRAVGGAAPGADPAGAAPWRVVD